MHKRVTIKWSPIEYMLYLFYPQITSCPLEGGFSNASNYAKFAFYVSGEEPSTYYIYNETAKKWLSYELKDSYRAQTGFVKMVENKEEAKAFKLSHLYTNRNSQAIACEFLHL